MKETYITELHKEASRKNRELLEVKLLLVDLKLAMERQGFRPDLVRKIELRVKPSA